jgi:Domain of unknown function (DUF6458)
MGIGAGIFLIALGAILTFAVNWHVHGLDLHAVGWVLMLAGLAGIILYFIFWNNRRRPRTVVTQQPYGQPPQYQETVTYQDPNSPPPPGY